MSHKTKPCWQVETTPGVSSVEAGLARQQILADQLISQSATPSLLIWRCRQALLVSRSEARLPHFESASVGLERVGWPVLLRKSGGQACPVGKGTIQAAMIETASPDATMNAKYAVLAELIQVLLHSYQIIAQTGLIAGAYCPGNYDLAVARRKLAGMSQHWFRNRCGIHCVITAASINVEEPPDVLAAVINQFYSIAGSSVRCQVAALTNMRLCSAMPQVAEQDLTAAVMEQLKSKVGMLA